MLLDQLKLDLTAAVKNRDHSRVLVLRFLLAEIHNQEIELHSRQQKLTEEVILPLFKKRYTVARRQSLLFNKVIEPILLLVNWLNKKSCRPTCPPSLPTKSFFF